MLFTGNQRPRVRTLVDPQLRHAGRPRDDREFRPQAGLNAQHACPDGIIALHAAAEPAGEAADRNAHARTATAAVLGRQLAPGSTIPRTFGEGAHRYRSAIIGSLNQRSPCTSEFRFDLYPISCLAAATILSTRGMRCCSSGGLSGTGTAGKLSRRAGFLSSPKPSSANRLATSEATLAAG
jgi:hypothetical protein